MHWCSRVIIVDATMNEPAEESTFLGKLQREKFGVVAGVTFAAVGSVIAFFAHMSIVIFAFSKTVGLALRRCSFRFTTCSTGSRPGLTINRYLTV